MTESMDSQVNKESLGRLISHLKENKKRVVEFAGPYETIGDFLEKVEDGEQQIASAKEVASDSETTTIELTIQLTGVEYNVLIRYLNFKEDSEYATD